MKSRLISSAMQQPMAVELRFLFLVIKINADLERVGDRAVTIAERVMELAKICACRASSGHCAHGVDCRRHGSPIAPSLYRRERGSGARVLGRDDVVDMISREAFDALTQVMHTKPTGAPQALDAFIVARNLERVADHATNIAEDVIFLVEARDVRHRHEEPAAP